MDINKSSNFQTAGKGIINMGLVEECDIFRLNDFKR